MVLTHNHQAPISVSVFSPNKHGTSVGIHIYIYIYKDHFYKESSNLNIFMAQV